MSEYVLDHHDKAERPRLALMSQLLDPMHHRYLEELGIGLGYRTLEIGCGNGSISAWLAEQILPDGRAVAVDLDLSLIESSAPNLEFRKADILAGPVSPGDFDLVTARAVLHHVARAADAIANIAASVRPGGSILLIEPHFLPASVAEPATAAAFWQGWLAWSRSAGVGYIIWPRVPRVLAGLGMQRIEATAETEVYNGGSLWAQYWMQTVIELRGRLLASGELDDRTIDAFLDHCADPRWWTQAIAFTAVRAHAPAD